MCCPMGILESDRFFQYGKCGWKNQFINVYDVFSILRIAVHHLRHDFRTNVEPYSGATFHAQKLKHRTSGQYHNKITHQ